MNNKKLLQVAFLIVLAGLALFALKKKPQLQAVITDFQSCEQAGGTIVDGEPVKCMAPNGQEFNEADHATDPDVVLAKPQYGELVKSPLTISGKARGSWFFEASMPVTLKDDSGKVLFNAPIHATEDWMTTDYVNFEGTFTFNPGSAQYGVLIIQKDNPSGDPSRDASVAIPVRFK
jgi:hypothetical protein